MVCCLYIYIYIAFKHVRWIINDDDDDDDGDDGDDDDDDDVQSVKETLNDSPGRSWLSLVLKCSKINGPQIIENGDVRCPCFHDY